MSSTPRYYYVDAQNQAAGPIPMPELQSLQASGTITDSTLVVIEGGQDWVAFSTLRPSAQPAPQAAASVTIAPKPAPTSSTPAASTPSSQSEPAWATQLLQKIDQLTLTAEKIVTAIEKNSAPRTIAAPVPATAALHAEKVNLNPIPKPGLAQVAGSPTIPAATPAAPPPRPGVSTPLSPLAVPANAVKPGLPLPALGAPVPSPGKPGNVFSKFLKK